MKLRFVQFDRADFFTKKLKNNQKIRKSTGRTRISLFSLPSFDFI